MGRKFAVIGGDKRSLALVNLLEEDGHNVRNLVNSDYGYLEFADDEIIIGPLPFTHDNENLDAPFHDKKINIEEVFKAISKEQYFIAGNIPAQHMKKAMGLNINIIDYFKREEMQIANAIPTAEGAVLVAMENLSRTIHKSKILLLGYGRIGKALSNLLYKMGAETYVAARDYGDIARIESLKYNSILFKDINKVLSKVDVVFNTVPSLVLTKDELLNMSKETLIIDLASNPGGVDFDCAKDLGINALHAQGLPGKYAPVTAANIIKETIYNIVDERGI